VHERHKNSYMNIFITVNKMPRCAIAERCLFPELPLEGRHFCAICKEQLHGPCGVFNGDESNITYRNRCYKCGSPSKVAAAAASTAASTTNKSKTTEASTIPGTQQSATQQSATQQSSLVSAKDIDPKDVTWDHIVVGDRPSTKPGQSDQMVKSVSTICGIDSMKLNTDQLRQICTNLKISGYRSKKKSDILEILAVAKIHNSFYEESGEKKKEADPKTPAKTKNCPFRLLNVLFSDEMSPKFEKLGARKDKNLLDSGLAGNDEYFWQEVAEKYQEKNVEFDELAYEDAVFEGIDPSVKLEHSWSKLREIYKAVSKTYSEVFENFKQSGNHDDFINFCGNKFDVYYLYLWLQEKPQLENMVVAELPEGLFFDSGKNSQGSEFEVKRRPSPTGSELSFARSSGGKSSVANSINALVEERKKSREATQADAAYKSQKLEMQISRNYDDNVKRLIDVKRQLETETNPGIRKVLKKYEKKLLKVVDLSSSSSDSSV